MCQYLMQWHGALQVCLGGDGSCEHASPEGAVPAAENFTRSELSIFLLVLCSSASCIMRSRVSATYATMPIPNSRRVGMSSSCAP